MKIKKRRKSSRMHGKGMGSHGLGTRKAGKGTGHKGGKGMSGSGKRADHKKSLVLKLYGHGYFGKQGITSKGTERDKRKRISIQDIEGGLEKHGKKTEKGWEINLKAYKILGGKKGYEVKNKLIIKAKEASKSVIESVKKAGGEIMLPIIKKIETPKVYSKKNPKAEPKETLKKEVKKDEL